MVEVIEAEQPAEAVPQAIDAFGYWPEHASKVRGLGGPASGPDETYAFHSPYVPCGTGRAQFDLRFTELQATSGSLFIKVLSHVAGSAHAVQEEAQDYFVLERMAIGDGAFFIRVDTVAERNYCVLGHIFDATDATATALSCEYRTGLEKQQQALEAALDFTPPHVRDVARMASVAAPSLTYPVSQAYTPEQVTDAAADDLRAAHPGLPQDPQALWPYLYIRQALSGYGLLTPGIRGLLFQAGGYPVADLLAGEGCELTVVRSSVEAETEAEALVPAHAGDVPEGLGGFHFAISFGIIDGMVADQAADFALRTIECLSPKGMALHMTMLAEPDGDETGALDRNTVQRIALKVMTFGHSVAQLRLPRAVPGGPPLPLGIMFQRG